MKNLSLLFVALLSGCLLKAPPANSPKSTSDDSPKTAPADSPKAAPVDSPKSTPAATPKSKQGDVTLTSEGNITTLKNSQVTQSWQLDNGKLSCNRLAAEKLSQKDCELFRLSSLPIPAGKPDWLYVGIRTEAQNIEAVISHDGESWKVLRQFKHSDFGDGEKHLRYGKMNAEAMPINYSEPGETGICYIQNIAPTAEAVRTIHKSMIKGATDKTLTITAPAHHVALCEQVITRSEFFASCRVNKGTDSGMTWGPGVGVAWKNGKSIRLGLRNKRTLNLNVNGDETFIPVPQFPPAFNIKSSDFRVSGKLKTSKIQGNPNAARYAERLNGYLVTAELVHKANGITAQWSARLVEKANYIHQELAFTSASATDITAVELLDVAVQNARQIGNVPGSPVATDSMFFGVELPVCSNEINSDSVAIWFPCKLTLTPDKPYRFSTVCGVYPTGQLRRVFQNYLRFERAHPYHQFLHYNCWYDLGMNPTEAGMIDVIKEYGKHLVAKGVSVESFVIDDGWDNYGKGLWAMNRKKFPNGFKPVCDELEKINSHLGIWISPLGGYSGIKERTEFARQMGLITGDELDLSEPGYYKWYRDTCQSMMKDLGVNYFKWDKAGSGVSPHFMALLDIATELRVTDPDVFINVTVGTWPSPFWLNHVDCTWRHGADVGWSGKGDERERWITYRDTECYRRVVIAAPLYPLNSIMHHGVVHGRHFQGKTVSKAGGDLKNEARSYFGAGANLQELYLTPSMMSGAAWAYVADAAKWARKNADVLEDVHWVGGDPGKLEPYGYAAWNSGRGTLTLRNPDDADRTIELELNSAFETKVSAFQLNSPYTDQRVLNKTVETGGKLRLTLKPFEVLVFDAKAAQ